MNGVDMQALVDQMRQKQAIGAAMAPAPSAPVANGGGLQMPQMGSQFGQPVGAERMTLGATPESAAASQAGTQMGAAGIAAGAQLLGGLMAQRAAGQQAKAQGMAEAAKTEAEGMSKAAAQAGKSQQDAFTKLMSSYRAAL